MIIGFFKKHNVIVDHANDSITIDDTHININTISSISSTLLKNDYDELTEAEQTENISIQSQIEKLKSELLELKLQHSLVKSTTSLEIPESETPNKQTTANPIDLKEC
jgi:hypothetical protein